MFAPTMNDLLDYHALFEHAGVGLLELTFDGCIRRINPDGAAFFGFSVGELTGRSVLDLTHPDDIPRTLDALQHVIDATASLVVLEKRYIRADGEIVYSTRQFFEE